MSDELDEYAGLDGLGVENARRLDANLEAAKQTWLSLWRTPYGEFGPEVQKAVADEALQRFAALHVEKMHKRMRRHLAAAEGK